VRGNGEVQALVSTPFGYSESTPSIHRVCIMRIGGCTASWSCTTPSARHASVVELV